MCSPARPTARPTASHQHESVRKNDTHRVRRGEGGQLGHGDGEDRTVPVLIARERLGNDAVFMAAAGGLHTVSAD